MKATIASRLSPWLGLVLCLLGLIGSIVVHQFRASAQAPCSTPPPQPGTNGAAWATGVTVNVYINPNDFSPQQITAIQNSFNTWKEANISSSGNGSGVRFNFNEATAKPAGHNVYYVERGPATTGAVSALSTNVFPPLD